ncbi:hypothetical protein GPA27_03285 [Aromatoleum toluolicum]|uniref:Uncharacterized protein n=1 Tax=Aromatoleum toluolicum TaxID=90060 RepID=A0ABX1NAV8_9RHOO|nr:hypothetical protein [Aromatoleum toluolicum]NMF96418.1 hypothetical protein [Aromatoleum toluolicum]
MLDSFFAIRLILRYGTAAAVVLAVLCAVGGAFLFWPIIGWFAAPAALFAGGLTFLLCKSYVELVTIVFQMVN